MPAPSYPIELDTIILRPFTVDDTEEFCAYRCLPEVARYVRWRPDDRAGPSIALHKRVASTSVDQPGQPLMLAVIEKTTGRLIGEVMLDWHDSEHRTGEVGYALHPDVHGRGIALEAARAMVAFGFDVLRLHRVIGSCDPRNGASVKVLQRLGLHEEAHFRQNEFIKGEWCDELVFAILATEWTAAQHPKPA